MLRRLHHRVLLEGVVLRVRVAHHRRAHHCRLRGTHRRRAHHHAGVHGLVADGSTWSPLVVEMLRMRSAARVSHGCWLRHRHVVVAAAVVVMLGALGMLLWAGATHIIWWVKCLLLGLLSLHPTWM